MASWAACVRERRRTYEGCRDLHQTRSVLAAVSGGGRALRERDPPSFGPTQVDLRICFEILEDGQDPQGNRASGALQYCSAEYHCALQHGQPGGWSQEPSTGSGLGVKSSGTLRYYGRLFREPEYQCREVTRTGGSQPP